jgi:hypothetical protein
MTGTLHEDQYTFVIISRSFLIRMRNVLYKSRRGNQNTHFVFSNFFSIIVPSMRHRGKILYSGAGHRWQYDARALHAGYLRSQIHTLRLCNINCFSTTKMLARTRVYVNVILTSTVLLYTRTYVIRISVNISRFMTLVYPVFSDWLY